MLRGSRIVGFTAAVAAAVVLSVVAPAAATAPRAGAIYTGQVAGSGGPNVVTFKVSKSGASVRNMRIGSGYPFNKCGGGGPTPSQSSKPAAVNNGKFTAHVVFRQGGSVIARATASGKFLRHGKEKGVVTMKIVGGPKCGESLNYTTRAE